MHRNLFSLSSCRAFLYFKNTFYKNFYLIVSPFIRSLFSKIWILCRRPENCLNLDISAFLRLDLPFKSLAFSSCFFTASISNTVYDSRSLRGKSCSFISQTLSTRSAKFLALFM